MTKNKQRYTVREITYSIYGKQCCDYWVCDAHGGDACGWVRSRQMARDVAAMLNRQDAYRCRSRKVK